MLASTVCSSRSMARSPIVRTTTTVSFSTAATRRTVRGHHLDGGVDVVVRTQRVDLPAAHVPQRRGCGVRTVGWHSDDEIAVGGDAA